MTKKLPSLLLNILQNNMDNEYFFLILGEYFANHCKKRISTSSLAQANFGPHVWSKHILINITQIKPDTSSQ